MKKLLIIGGVIIALFALIIVLNNQSNKAKLSGDNPYGNKKLDQATIDQLNDPNYQNIILPDELEDKIASGEPVVAYFFSPTCPHCKEMTPRLMPIAKDMGVDINQYNLLEYEQGWQQYNIEYTPTMVYYEDGKEVYRTVGSIPDDQIKSYFNDVVLK